MSEESLSQGRYRCQARKIRSSEADLLNSLLVESGLPILSSERLDEIIVQEMLDGGMGSIYLLSSNPLSCRIFGRRIAELQFDDLDGTPIVASLNIDQYGDLFELDVWKVDFSPVKN